MLRELTTSASALVSVKSLLVAILTLLSFGVVAAAVQAMPFRSAQTGSTIPVSSGCGIGVNSGPYDGCDVIYRGDYRAHDDTRHRARLKRKLDAMPGAINAAPAPAIRNFITKRETAPNEPAATPIKFGVDLGGAASM
jgi:hypothetical protein